nr:hypothetical protein [Tanacetum cinerariifolium]
MVPSLEPSPEHWLPSPSNDSLPSGKDSMKLKELMDLYTHLSNKVLELESEVIDIKSTCKERIEKLEGRVNRLEEENRVLKDLHSVHSKVDTGAPIVEKDKSFKQERIIVDINKDVEINFEEAQAKPYRMDLEHQEKVFSMQDADDEEPAEVKEVVEEAKAAKLMTKVVTTAGATTTAEATKVSVPRRKKGVVIQDHKETTSTVVVHSVVQSKDKGKEATPLASKIPIVNYNIHFERNKPYFNIIIKDGNHMLLLSFGTLLKNFDREDPESFWKLIKERFEKTKSKNYTDDYVLKTLKTIFEQPNVEASVWRDQKGRYGLAKVKSWKLFESVKVHCITFSTTQMFFLVEKRYPLTHFTLEQMVTNVRLEVEVESEMSLELLRLVRRQLNEGYVPE